MAHTNKPSDEFVTRRPNLISIKVKKVETKMCRWLHLHDYLDGIT